MVLVKKLMLFLGLFGYAVACFSQVKPPVAPQQVGTGLAADVGKLLWMDANGRGTLSPLSTILGQNTTWNVGGNSVSAASIIGTITNQDLVFKTNNVERMRILSDTKSGLQIGRLSSSSGQILFQTKYDGNALTSLIDEYSTGSLGFAYGMYQNGTSVWRNSYNYGSIPRSAFLSGINGVRYITSPAASIALDSALTIQPIEVFRLTQTGNIGLGITNPAEKIDIANGNVQISGSSPFFNAVSSTGMTTRLQSNATLGTIGTTNNYDFAFLTNGAERMRITAAGKIGIGKIPSFPFDMYSPYGSGSMQFALNTSDSTLRNINYDQFVMQGKDVPTWRFVEKDNASQQEMTYSIGDGYANIAATKPLRFFSNSLIGGYGYNGGGGLLTMFIDNAKVAIGGTNTQATAKLDIDGDIRIRSQVGGSSNDSIATLSPLGVLNKRTVASVLSTSSPFFATSKATASTNVAGAYYLKIGGAEYNTNSYRLIGFGYQNSVNQHFPAYIGYQEKDINGMTKGDLLFGTRDVITDAEPSERMRITANGNIGIGTTTPSSKLHVVGSSLFNPSDAGLTTTFIANSLNNNSLQIKATSGNTYGMQLSCNITTDDATISNYYNANLILKTNNTERFRITPSGNNSYGQFNFYNAAGTVLNSSMSDGGTLSLNNVATGLITNQLLTISASGAVEKFPTLSTQVWLKGGQTGNLTGGTTDNSWVFLKQNNVGRVTIAPSTTNISNSQYTELATIDATNSQPSVRLSNGSAIGSNTYISSNINSTIGNVANTGDLIINPNTGNMAMAVNYERRDFAFGVNHQQKCNISLVDGSDTARITLSDTTRMLRLYKGLSVPTTKVKVTLPSFPQPQMRITVLCEDDATGVIFSSPSSAQSIKGADTFSVVSAGDVIEAIFIYNEYPSAGNSGHWYCKKL